MAKSGEVYTLGKDTSQEDTQKTVRREVKRSSVQ